jgi:hypothetical protein
MRPPLNQARPLTLPSGISVVIIIDAGPSDALRAFQITVARLEETAMGILVYSLISTFVWPQSSRSDLEESSRKLLAGG